MLEGRFMRPSGSSQLELAGTASSCCSDYQQRGFSSRRSVLEAYLDRTQGEDLARRVQRGRRRQGNREGGRRKQCDSEESADEPPRRPCEILGLSRRCDSQAEIREAHRRLDAERSIPTTAARTTSRPRLNEAKGPIVATVANSVACGSERRASGCLRGVGRNPI